MVRLCHWLVCVVLASASLHAQKPANENSGESMQKLLTMVPLHAPIRKIRLPQFDKEGKQIALIKAAVARRVSESKFHLEELEIDLFADGVAVGVITTAQARFNMKSKILASDVRTTIERSVGKTKFRTEGTRLVFHVDKQIGSILRNSKTQLTLPKSTKGEQ